MDTFLRKVLSNTITVRFFFFYKYLKKFSFIQIAELQHLQGEIEGQLALSNGDSSLAAQRNIVKGILDYMSRNQNQVANPIDGPVAGNTEYMVSLN